MRLSNFIEGLNILQPYYDNPNGFHVGAEHDQFYAYATEKPLSEAALNKLVELGWFQPDVEVPDDEEYNAKLYQPEEGWSAYV